MMRIGILTYHDGLNHGAYLQAFATMRILQEAGHDIRIINYKNREHWLQEDVRPWFKYRRPVRFIDRIKKQRAFKEDHKRFAMTAFTKSPDKVQKLDFDVVVVGSDVVWNYKIFGFDALYFGKLPARRVISYASSFGWANLEGKHPDGVEQGLKSFDAISVRDSNTWKIVKEYTGYDTPTVLDPTLIYDFSKDERASVWPEKLGPYMLVYAYVADQQVIDKIKELARERGLTIVSLGYRQFWCDKVLMEVGPLEWLTLYDRASYVVTSTFHGTIFSLKYNKEFLYIKNERAHNRIVTLAELTGLTNAFFDTDTPYREINPDYESVNRLIEKSAVDSRDWLFNSLD